MKWFWVGGFALILLGYMVWRFGSAEVFSPAVLARLKPGMTTNEVAAILGPPSSMRNGEWVYLRPFMHNVGIVFFDDGHVASSL